MKSMKKYWIAAALLLVCAAGVSAEEAATAAPAVPATQAAQSEEITIFGQIEGYFTGTEFKFVEPSGVVHRADFGKYGPRLLTYNPFEATGKFVETENGTVFKASSIVYEDPVPDTRPMSYMAERVKTESELGGTGAKLVRDRDPAYYHDNLKSDHWNYYGDSQNGAPAVEAYKEVTAADLKNEIGNRVAIDGATIRTGPDGMIFRTADRSKITLQMNGLKIPLGQRSTVCGTVVDDHTISVERIKSVAQEG